MTAWDVFWIIIPSWRFHSSHPSSSGCSIGGLTKAEAGCGVIPAEAAEWIAAACDFDALDFDLLRRETDNVGYPILPLVHQLVHQCGEAKRYVH
jgi:hypothetical protein